MERYEVDVAIVGVGSAGITARRAALRAGAKVLNIDPGPYGTTCARVGCMPSKMLVAAAEAAHDAARAGALGVRCSVEVDGPAVLERLRALRDRFAGATAREVERWLEEGEVIPRRARLAGGTALDLLDEQGEVVGRVEARAIVLAPGSRTFVPPPFRGLDRDVLLTNDSVFELPDLPGSLLVVGTGAIALELGQAMHRLGVRVTLVGIDGLVGPARDPVVREHARRLFSDELDIHDDYRLEEVERTDEGVRVRFRDPDGTLHEGTYEKVLVAAGRLPNLDGLGLENVGLEPGRVPPFDPSTMQVEDRPLFLAGDVTGERALLHEAADEGRFAGENAARYPDVRPFPRRTPLAIVFSDPQFALFGARWDELDRERHAVGSHDYRRQGRARILDVNRGIVRIYGERRSRRIVGGELLGPRMEHMGHLLAWAVHEGVTIDRALAELPFYHPVLEEGIRSAIRNLRRAMDGPPQEELPAPA